MKNEKLRRRIGMVSPCYGCKKRRIGCHAECEDFAGWSEQHKNEREERQKKAFLEGQARCRRRDAVAQYYKRERS